VATINGERHGLTQRIRWRDKQIYKLAQVFEGLEPMHLSEAELLEVAKLLLDFYNLETQLFVEKYGHGITTRILGDRARAAIAKATNQKP
jgi:hypothetical protein